MDTMDTRETLTEEQLRERFDELLNEIYPEVKVAGYTFSPSDVLKDGDPIAYECELRGYADDIRDEYLVPGWND